MAAASGAPQRRPRDDVDEVPLFMAEEPDAADVAANPTLAALSHLIYDQQPPEEQAERFKSQGNDALKRGRLHYKEALQLYTQAIDAGSSIKPNLSVYYSNRAAVNLLLGNYGRVLEDCEKAVELDATNVKALYRAAKAANALSKFQVALESACKGLLLEPDNKAMLAEKATAEAKLKAQHEREAEAKRLQDQQAAEAQRAGELVRSRGLTIGAPFPLVVQYVQPARDVWYSYLHCVDNNGDGSAVAYPTIFLYPEFRQSDFVPRLHEQSTLLQQLLLMFPTKKFKHMLFGKPPAAPPEWDTEQRYLVENLELCYVTNWTQPLPVPLPGGGASKPKPASSDRRVVSVKLNSTLADVLGAADYTIPGAPVFFVLSKDSPFRDTFMKLSDASLEMLQ